MTTENEERYLNAHGNIDPAQCPFRETCPELMACVTEFLVELARADWGVKTEGEESQGEDHGNATRD